MSIPNIYVLLYHPKIEGKKTSEGSYCLSPHLPYCCTIPKQKKTHLRGLTIYTHICHIVVPYIPKQKQIHQQKSNPWNCLFVCFDLLLPPPPFLFFQNGSLVNFNSAFIYFMRFSYRLTVTV